MSRGSEAGADEGAGEELSTVTVMHRKSVITVARKEFYDSVRARSLWALAAIFALIMIAAVYAFSFLASTAPEMDATGETLVGVLSNQGSGFVTAFVSILGLLVGYSSVVDERSTGTAKFLLGLPHSRRDVIVGKAAGRSAVLVAAFAVGFVLSGLVLLTYESADFLLFAGFAALTTVLGVIFVCISIGISASIKTRSRVTASAVGTFFFFAFLWDSTALPRLLVRILTGDFGVPDWFDFAVALSPNVAYSNTASLLGNTELGRLEGFSVVVLVAWLVVPLAFGYLRFKNSDI